MHVLNVSHYFFRRSQSPPPSACGKGEALAGLTSRYLFVLEGSFFDEGLIPWKGMGVSGEAPQVLLEELTSPSPLL
jgi:hypothetical protein